jgi:hypothetical protein
MSQKPVRKSLFIVKKQNLEDLYCRYTNRIEGNFKALKLRRCSIFEDKIPRINRNLTPFVTVIESARSCLEGIDRDLILTFSIRKLNFIWLIQSLPEIQI